MRSKRKHHHFLTDLYITTKHHHRRNSKLIFNCDTGADTLGMSKKTYMSLTTDYGLKHLGLPDGSPKNIWCRIAENLEIATLHI